MKLKPGGKIALFLIIGIAAYFVIKPYLPENKTDDTNTSITNNSPSVASGSEDERSNSSSAATEGREFNYTPDKPVNGTLRGVVEVGATGFNSFVINMDKERRWEIISKDLGNLLPMRVLRLPTTSVLD